jgi:hypothetical protein
MCTTQQLTINNNTVSINMNDVLPAIVKLGLDRELSDYNGLALTLGDFYQDQTASRDFQNWPMSTISRVANDRCYKPRGTLSGVRFSDPKLGTASVDGWTWGSDVGESTVNALVDAAGEDGLDYSFTVTATFTEPLICSPFIYSNPYYNGQGFYGIQNLNFVFNISTEANSGFFRTANYDINGYANAGATITNAQFSDSRLIFNFLSPKPSDMLTARNVVPYWEMPRFTTSNFSGPAARTDSINGALVPSTATCKSQSIQLNMIPDKLIIFLRPAKSQRTTNQADWVFPISKISVNFNNQSGILASATQDQLWRFSVESGSNQTWDEFRGVANAAGATAGLPTFDIPMLGSYLMLEMGRHIQITEDYYASGSLGNFNLQFDLTYHNYADQAYTANGAVELVLITQNSGIFVTEKGQSATYTGVLTKDDVLSVSGSDSVNERALSRMVGGSFLGKISGMTKKFLPMLNNIAQQVLGDTGKMGSLKRGLQTAENVRGAVQGEGRAGSRLRGSGKGSAKFDLEDRLV